MGLVARKKNATDQMWLMYNRWETAKLGVEPVIQFRFWNWTETQFSKSEKPEPRTGSERLVMNNT